MTPSARRPWQPILRDEEAAHGARILDELAAALAPAKTALPPR